MKLKLPHWSVNPRRKINSTYISGPSYTSYNFSRLMHKIRRFGLAAQNFFFKNTVYRKNSSSPFWIISSKPKSKRSARRILSYLQIQQVRLPKWLSFRPPAASTSSGRGSQLSVLTEGASIRRSSLLVIRHLEQFQQRPNSSEITLRKRWENLGTMIS